MAPGDPFILENAMDGFNKAGDYAEQGCAHYEKAVAFGEAALALLQGSTVTIEGHVRSYPTQPIKENLGLREFEERSRPGARSHSSPIVPSH